MAWRPRFLPWLLVSAWTDNPGNKTIRCGVITIVTFLGLINFGERLHISADAFIVGLVIVLGFGFATLFFAGISVRVYFRKRGSTAKQAL